MPGRGEGGEPQPTSTPTHPDLGALYLRHRVAMYAVASNVLGGRGLQAHVEDIVMDVIADLLARPPREAVKNWEAYLVSATRNKAVDLIRSAAVRRSGGPLSPEQEPTVDEHIADDVAQSVDDRMLGGHVWDLLARLEPRDRRILTECVMHERPQEQVAREFGISRSRVSQICSDALRTLQAELTKEGLQR